MPVALQRGTSLERRQHQRSSACWDRPENGFWEERKEDGNKFTIFRLMCKELSFESEIRRSHKKMRLEARHKACGRPRLLQR
jgi:hypothetical protein